MDFHWFFSLRLSPYFKNDMQTSSKAIPAGNCSSDEQAQQCKFNKNKSLFATCLLPQRYKPCSLKVELKFYFLSIPRALIPFSHYTVSFSGQELPLISESPLPSTVPGLSRQMFYWA